MGGKGRGRERKAKEGVGGEQVRKGEGKEKVHTSTSFPTTSSLTEG